MSARTIDLNADVGESFYDRKVGCDDRLIPLVTSANIACGFHGGDPLTMVRAIAIAARKGVRIGAHPSYFDREGFGRRRRKVDPALLEAQLAYQLTAIRGLAALLERPLSHVKAHGTLYHDASRDLRVAGALLSAIAAVCPKARVVCAAGSPFARAAAAAGFRVLQEGFVDRRYAPDGTLVPRSDRRALITNPAEAAAQALTIALEGRVRTITGQVVALKADTLCLHGDGPRAFMIAKAVRKALNGAGCVIRAPR